MWKIRMEIWGLSLDKKRGRLKGCNAIFSSPLSRLSKNETPVGQNRNRLSTSPRSLFHCMRNSFEYRAAFASDRMARRRRRKRRIRAQVSHLTCRSKETLSFRISDPVFVPISFPQFRLLFSERTIISNESNAQGRTFKNLILPKTVIELETNMASNHTAAILKPTIRLVDVCLVRKGFRMPRYRPNEMKHMCIMLAEQASTSHVTYTLHHTTPNGQYPATFNVILSSQFYRPIFRL